MNVADRRRGVYRVPAFKNLRWRVLVLGGLHDLLVETFDIDDPDFLAYPGNLTPAVDVTEKPKIKVSCLEKGLMGI